MLDRTRQPELKPFQPREVGFPERHVMANGAPLYVIHSDDADVTRVDLVFRGGRWDQELPMQAVFTLRMLKEGTRSLDYSTIAERLDFYGAWLDHYVTHSRSVLTLYSLNRYLPETLAVIEQMVKQPAFPADRLHSVVDTNRQKFLIMRRRTDYTAQRTLMQSLFGSSHPEGHITQPEDYEAIDTDSLRRFYNAYYRSRNLSVYLSGKISDSCIRRIEGIFGTPFGADGETARLKDFVPTASGGKHMFVANAEAQQSTVAMGLLTIGAEHPDFPKLRVAVTLLGGFFGSRLMSNIREDKGYTYGINAAMITCPGLNILDIAADCSNQYAEALISEVYKEIDRLQQEPVPQAELETVRNYMLGDGMRSTETAFTLADMWIMSQEQIGVPDLFQRSQRALVSATPADIMEMAQRNFCKEKLKEVVCGRKI